MSRIESFYRSTAEDFLLARGDSFTLLPQLDFKFDMIFADPPYFLSNGGFSYQSGQVVSVDKGEWDKAKSYEEVMDFNLTWLGLCRDKLKENGTIWISGTYHNIFSVAHCLQLLGYRILNIITWQKTNPPPNISRRFFTFSTEYIIWARKQKKTPHTFNYESMKLLNHGRQMTDVWQLPSIGSWEKRLGKHPTQKPLRLLVRIILASTHKAAWILDPFCGSGTTGIAANLSGRYFVGFEQETEYCTLARNRRLELDNVKLREELVKHIEDLSYLKCKEIVSEPSFSYGSPPF